jgi:hypothetical protein
MTHSGPMGCDWDWAGDMTGIEPSSRKVRGERGQDSDPVLI